MEKFAEQDKKLDAIFKSAEKMRKYFLWTMWVTIIMIVVPLIGLAFVIPSFLSTLPTNLGSLSGINLSGTGLK